MIAHCFIGKKKWLGATACCPRVSRAVILAAMFGALPLGVVERAAAHVDPPGCERGRVAVGVDQDPNGRVEHGNLICYRVVYSILGADDCSVTQFDSDLVLPGPTVQHPSGRVPITLGADIPHGSDFGCPSPAPLGPGNPCVTLGDPICNGTNFGLGGYAYFADHDHETGLTCVQGAPGSGILSALVFGEGIAHDQPDGEPHGAANAGGCAPKTVNHACCDPCNATCVSVSSRSACLFPGIFYPDFSCKEQPCTPLECGKCRSCDKATGQCGNKEPHPDGTICCNDDGGCPPASKCRPSHCDLASNRCVGDEKLPGCCELDAQCPGKCDVCDLASNTCVKGVPGCCDSHAQCEGDKCHAGVCDFVTNTCGLSDKFFGCCMSDAQCTGKCDVCDRASNTCVKGVPNCCDSDDQCGGDKCHAGLCDLATNTCGLSDKFEGCCMSDAQCTGKCDVCDLDPFSPTENTCVKGVPNCCDSDAQCDLAGTKCRTGVCNMTTNLCVLGPKEPKDCCEGDAWCSNLDTKCREAFCNMTTNLCELGPKTPPDCCETDLQCGKCEVCDPVDNRCYKDVPDCCTSDDQCGKCETCDLVTNTCNKDVPGCCYSDEQCNDYGTKCREGLCDLEKNTCYLGPRTPADCCETDKHCGKCETCDKEEHRCVKDVPGCCTSDDQCGKCETCDLVTNTCNKDVPDCCTSDEQCGHLDTKCRAGLCDLKTNTCILGPEEPKDCCEGDEWCVNFDTKCRTAYCDQSTNRCELGPKIPPDCCETDAQCGKCETCIANVCEPKTVPGCCTSDDQCGDDWKCTDDTCDTSSNTCVYTRIDLNCNDGFACTTDRCLPNFPDIRGVDPLSGCKITPDDSVCPAFDQCHVGVCDPKNWVPGPFPGGCTIVPGEPGNSCESDGDLCTVERCSEGGACQVFTPTPPGLSRSECPHEAAYYVAVVGAPTLLLSGTDELDDKALPPCGGDDRLDKDGNFYVEIYVTEFAAKSGGTGVACASVDLAYTPDPKYGFPINQEGVIGYGNAFTLLKGGTSNLHGNIDKLEGCTVPPTSNPPQRPKIGVFPRWALLARIKFVNTSVCVGGPNAGRACPPALCPGGSCKQQKCGDASFKLSDSGNITTVHNVHGSPWADPVDFGGECRAVCRAYEYDLNNDCLVNQNDFDLFAACWKLCPSDASYDTALNGKSCNRANYVGSCNPAEEDCCNPDNCVGPEDFPSLYGALEEGIYTGPNCTNSNFKLPLPCLRAGSALELPTDEELRSAGLEPPPADWKGYETLIPREIDKPKTQRDSERNKR